MSASDLIQLLPPDDHNRTLEANVRPADWENPTPKQRYNLVVIGAGTAGLVTAAGAASLGARVALVERELMGGDCLNVGCVPSKGLISAARVAATSHRSREFGIEVWDVDVDFPAVMSRMRRLRAQISPNDSAERFQGLGVDVFFGDARFDDSGTIAVGGTKLKFKRAVIATGSRPKIPAIPGLEEAAFLTNESLFSLTELPQRLAVLGAGPIGCEMAQTFAQFGSEVVLIESGHGILQREDRDAADIVQHAMLRDGVRLLCCGRQMRIQNGRLIEISVDAHDRSHALQVDQLLVSTGRTPNVESLNLEAVGVQSDRLGIQVNDRMQTTNPRIYAAGDVAFPYQFTHAADFTARIVIQNALFYGRRKSSALTIPWCTYTSPELAHVGLNEKQAEEQGLPIDTFVQHFSDVDRAILDGETEGLVKIHCKRGTDRIVGATIVAAHAGDMISEITLAMANGLGLSKIGNTIHPYPTQAEAIRKLGDQYSRTRLTPMVKRLFAKWLRWTR